MQARSHAIVLAVIGVFLLANTVALVFPPLVFPEITPACELNKAILCAELPRSGTELAAVLSHPANSLSRWARQVWLDFPFIVFYGLMLALGGWREARDSRARWGIVGVVMLGALLDVVENIGILSAVSALEDGPVPGATGEGALSNSAATLISASAQAKFILLSAGGALACVFVFRRTEHLLVKLVCGAAVVTCASVLLGLVWRAYFELGATGIALACFVLWFRNLAEAWRHGREPPPVASA